MKRSIDLPHASMSIVIIRQCRKPRHGFTLIELLVVIAIISILIAILLPALSRAKYQSQLVACASNTRQTAIAAIAYSVDETDFLPGSSSIGQGVMDTSAFGVDAVWGIAALVMKGYTVPQSLYNPHDIDRTYKDFEAEWSAMPTANPVTPSFRVDFSYALRQLDPVPTTSVTEDFQQLNSSGGVYVPPFIVSDPSIGSIIADRFDANFAYSWHGSTFLEGTTIPNDAGGNGEGWHVAYADGHATFQINDPEIYNYTVEIGSGGFANRHLNWSYWDDNP